MNKKIPKYLKLTFAASILGTSLLTGFPTNTYAEDTLTVLEIILVCSISIILWEYAISQKHRFEFLSFEYTKVLQNIINKGFLGFCSHTTIFQTEQMSSDFFDVFLRIK